MTRFRLNISITLEGEAFDGDPRPELARILNVAARSLDGNELSTLPGAGVPIFDSTWNRCGTYVLSNARRSRRSRLSREIKATGGRRP